MATEVSICNQAISWLAGNRIISLNDETTEARLCKDNYAHLRDVVLEERDWSFARARIQFARLAEDPLYGFSAAFAIPNDVISVLQATRGPEAGDASAGSTGPGFSRENLRNGKEQRIIWQVEGNTIVCDESNLVGRVTKRIVDPSKFSPGFVQALAARIAREIALPLTQSQTMEDKMKAKYTESIAEAGTSDGIQGTSNKIRSDALTRVR